jgi:tripartite-type tricarboxylate transporter receptor subunit TctC
MTVRAGLRLLRNAALAALALFAALPGPAAAYPERPIRIIIGYAPGSTIDLMARHIAEELSKRGGQPVIVENRPGAISAVAAQAVANAKPDGYTLLIAPDAAMAGNKFMFKQLNYDTDRDFAAVATVAVFEGFILTIEPKKTPVRTLAELSEFFKKKNTPTFYGVPNNPALVLAETYRVKTGFKAERINYKTSTDTLGDLQAGQIDFFFSDLQTVANRIKEGRLVGIAVAGPTRSTTLPDIPTLAEAGMPGLELDPWQAVFMHANTPPAIREQLGKWLVEIASTEEFKTLLIKLGALPYAAGPAEADKRLRDRTSLWKSLADTAKIVPE